MRAVACFQKAGSQAVRGTVWLRSPCNISIVFNESGLQRATQLTVFSSQLIQKYAFELKVLSETSECQIIPMTATTTSIAEDGEGEDKISTG